VVADLRDLTNRQSIGSAGVAGSSNFAPPFLTLPTVVRPHPHDVLCRGTDEGAGIISPSQSAQCSMINRHAALNLGKLLL
jgi:hypothetical protein